MQLTCQLFLSSLIRLANDMAQNLWLSSQKGRVLVFVSSWLVFILPNAIHSFEAAESMERCAATLKCAVDRSHFRGYQALERKDSREIGLVFKYLVR